MALPRVSPGITANCNKMVEMSVLRRAVFLDRDGVINKAFIRDGKPYPPNSVSELEILPGVQLALLRLRAAGLLNIVVTNQPDVATGIQQQVVVEGMHARLTHMLALDAIVTCYHVDADNCTCRKPLPGMLIESSLDYGIDLSKSYLVGDRWRDVAAGQAAGCNPPYFVDYEYLEDRPIKPYFLVKSLFEATTLILADLSSIN